MSYLESGLGSLPWTQGAHPLERKKTDPAVPVALLEFGPGFADPAWCARGHAGYVLSGAIEFELEDRISRCEAGNAFILEAGTRHRARNPGTEPVTLFIYSSESLRLEPSREE